LVIFVIILRLIPHLSNFTPIFAIGIFAAYSFKNKWISIALPLTSMLISDIFLGFYSEIWAVYLSMAIAHLLNFKFAQTAKAKDLAISSFIAPTIFYILSNLVVFVSWYPHNLLGLSECYISAIPFYGASLLATFGYTFLFWGIFGFSTNPKSSLMKKTL
jgi:hypothetical protein